MCLVPCYLILILGWVLPLIRAKLVPCSHQVVCGKVIFNVTVFNVDAGDDEAFVQVKYLRHQEKHSRRRRRQRSRNHRSLHNIGDLVQVRLHSIATEYYSKNEHNIDTHMTLRVFIT